MQKFREQTQQEDRERVIQAMEEMAKKQAEESSVVHEGPITLGYLIKPDEEITPMREIQDEERRKQFKDMSSMWKQKNFVVDVRY